MGKRMGGVYQKAYHMKLKLVESYCYTSEIVVEICRIYRGFVVKLENDCHNYFTQEATPGKTWYDHPQSSSEIRYRAG
jgi:hypothetical protein